MAARDRAASIGDRRRAGSFAGADAAFLDCEWWARKSNEGDALAAIDPIAAPMTALTQAFPGPRARFPGHLMFSFRADPLGFLQRCAAQYGDVCSFRGAKRRFILMSHPDDIRDVLVAKADHFTKSPALRQAK